MADSTNQTFNGLLKRYTPHNLLVEALKRLNYFWNKIPKDENWFGGTYDVPFESGEASALRFGKLTAAADITETATQSGTITNYRELYGSMIFNHKDLDFDDLKGSFLKILPDKLNQFMKRMSERVSQTILNGAHICQLANPAISGVSDPADTTGVCYMDKGVRLRVGQGLQLYNGTNTYPSASTQYYVKFIDRGAVAGYPHIAKVTLADDKAFAVLADLASDGSAYDATNNYKAYERGGRDSAFTSLASILLSSANGGDANVYGIAKASYPYLQAQQYDGSSIDETTIMDELCDAFNQVEELSSGSPTEILMSFKHFNTISKLNRDNIRFTATDKKIGIGFKSVQLDGIEGNMRITALRDMDDDKMFIMDWSALKFAGKHFFKKMDYNGKMFYQVRAETGVTNIVDIKLYGDLVVTAPCNLGVIFSISY
jgi:hypothetical protein